MPIFVYVLIFFTALFVLALILENNDQPPAP
jgi:hypothetical protein